MKHILRLLKYVTRYKKEVVLNVLFNTLYVFFNLFSLATVVPFTAVLFGVTPSPSAPPEFALSKDVIVEYVSYYLNYYKDTQGFFVCLLYISLSFVIMTLLSNLFRYLGFYFLAPVRNGVIRDIRNDLYHKITILPISYFSDQKRGDIISKMTSDLSVIEWTVFTCLQMVIKDPIMIIVYLSLLVVLSWKFVLFIVIVLPLPIFIIRRIGSSLSRNSLKGQNKAGILLSATEEMLSMIKTTKSLNAERIIREGFSAKNNSYTQTMNKVVARTELASPVTEFCFVIILTAIVLVGGVLVLKGEMNPAILIGFTVVLTRITSPIKELVTAYYNFQKGEASAVRVCEILDAEEKIEEKPNAKVITDFRDEISFEHVCFSYEGNDVFGIEDISFKIKKGQNIAVVGASGSGKSTLFDLFVRFADVKDGRITIDNEDIRNLNIDSLRSLFGIVTQQSILFNDTVRNNITFGRNDFSEDEIMNAVRLANCEEFINKLPQGLDTLVADSGNNFSGGERQRLCIARALIRNPHILLMDEPTSAMDTIGEKKVTQAIQSASIGRTTIVIAHRLSTIVHSDMILVMNDGKIVESGTHEELINRNGIYSKMVGLQKF